MMQFVEVHAQAPMSRSENVSQLDSRAVLADENAGGNFGRHQRYATAVRNIGWLG